MAADDLRGVAQAEGGVARVDALGGKGEEEVRARLQARGLQRRQQDVARRTGPRRRLEDDELTGLQACRDRLCRGVDRSEVRQAVLVQRGGHADDDGLAVAQDLGGGAWLEPVGDEVGHLVVADVVNVRLARAQAGDLALAGVETGHLHPGGHRLDHERQAHVTEPDDAEVVLKAHALTRLMCLW